VPHSVFSSTGSGSGQRTKRGSSERGLEFDSQDVFSVLRPMSDVVTRSTGQGDDGTENMVGKAGSKFPDELGLLFKADLSADDGDPWVDTDSVSSESAGTDLN